MEPGRKSPKREICRSKASRWASRAGRESGINGTPPPSVSYTLGYMPQKKKHAHANFHVPHPTRTHAHYATVNRGTILWLFVPLFHFSRKGWGIYGEAGAKYPRQLLEDRKSTRLNSSHLGI